MSARAMPGAMPWDHAGGPGRPDCTACHFDAEAVRQSPAVSLIGLPEKAISGREYDLILRLDSERLITAGFLMRALSGAPPDGDVPRGRFVPADGRTEAGTGAIRSTKEGARQVRPQRGEWRFSWRTPKNFKGKVTMYIAAMAGNDDESPLGDRVYLRQLESFVTPENP